MRFLAAFCFCWSRQSHRPFLAAFPPQLHATLARMPITTRRQLAAGYIEKDGKEASPTPNSIRTDNSAGCDDNKKSSRKKESQNRPELYFPDRSGWRTWLEQHHCSSTTGVYLIFYRVTSSTPSMRWEEAVQEALCFGWIDSTVKRLDEERRRQFFCPRKPKSTWSKVNKQYIVQLEHEGRMHASGRAAVETAKRNGSWTILDAVEEGVVPDDLEQAFSTTNPQAKKNFDGFAPGYRKSYLRWLNEAKREATRKKRINEIIQCCLENKKRRLT